MRACKRAPGNGSPLQASLRTDTVPRPVMGLRPARDAEKLLVWAEARGGNDTLRMRMTKRKLAAGVLALAGFTVGVSVAVLPASADQRTLVVTLATGQTGPGTVDVPPGTPLDQIHIPGISTPIVGVSEVSSPSQPDQPPVQVGTGQQPPPQATPEAPAAAPTDNGAQQQQQAQQTTGKAKRKPHTKVEAPTVGGL